MRGENGRANNNLVISRTVFILEKGQKKIISYLLNFSILIIKISDSAPKLASFAASLFSRIAMFVHQLFCIKILKENVYYLVTEVGEARNYKTRWDSLQS